MNVIRRIAGLLLVATGIMVAVHMIIEPLYHVSSEAYPFSPFWGYIDPLMALAVLLGVIFGYVRTRATGRDSGGALINREYLVANLQLYGFLFVGILFFWNLFNILNPEYTAAGADTTAVVWVFIDATLPLLSVPMGLHLVRGDRE